MGGDLTCRYVMSRVRFWLVYHPRVGIFDIVKHEFINLYNFRWNLKANMLPKAKGGEFDVRQNTNVKIPTLSPAPPLAFDIDRCRSSGYILSWPTKLYKGWTICISWRVYGNFWRKKIHLKTWMHNKIITWHSLKQKITQVRDKLLKEKNCSVHFG